ncbi:MAG: YcaO-like family protein, partial [Candidatus Daviesbacteria bacterium]|nr:YcaO-like family protein [Candidatus Daviesbacteria bacterium]
MLNKGELREVFPARVWLESLAAGGKLSFLKRIILEAIALLLGYFEEMIGELFYVSAPLNKDWQMLSPAVFKKILEIGEAGFFKSMNFHRTLPDEPRAVIATARFGELVFKSDGNKTEPEGWSGADLESPEKAAMRCVGEAVERTCLYVYRDKDLVSGSFKELENRGAINPREFAAFSVSQLKNDKFSRCRFDENSRFGWAAGKSLITGKKVLAPAQLIYLSYKYKDQEPTIRQRISTGAAAYTDWEEALYRGICEVIERDAWMIHWLNELSPPRIDLENSPDEDLRKLTQIFRRKNLELHVLDITTDIPLPTF